MGEKERSALCNIIGEEAVHNKENFLAYISDFNFELTNFRRHHHLFELCKVWNILMVTEFSFLKSIIYISFLVASKYFILILKMRT